MMDWPQFWQYQVYLGLDNLREIERLWLRAVNEEVDRSKDPLTPAEVRSVRVATSDRVVLTQDGVFLTGDRTVRLDRVFQP